MPSLVAGVGKTQPRPPGVFSFWCQVVRHHHSEGVEGGQVEERDRGRAGERGGSEELSVVSNRLP